MQRVIEAASVRRLRHAWHLGFHGWLFPRASCIARRDARQPGGRHAARSGWPKRKKAMDGFFRVYHASHDAMPVSRAGATPPAQADPSGKTPRPAFSACIMHRTMRCPSAVRAPRRPLRL